MAAATYEPFIRDVYLLRDRVPSFDEYPFNIPGIHGLTQLALHPKVTYFIGENGTGKSTLLEAIAVVEGLNAEGGSRNFNFATRPSHSKLCEALRINRGHRRRGQMDAYFLRAESFYNVATELDRVGDPRVLMEHYGGRSLHEQSHGESFISLVTGRFRGDGLYLLDEPEAALSPSRQMSMLTAIHDLLREGSQFIIATHSPIVMAYPEATIYEFSPAGIQPINYLDSEHYKVTRLFLDRREQMLRELLAEPDAGDAPNERGPSGS